MSKSLKRTEAGIDARRQRSREVTRRKWQEFAPKIADIKLQRGCADCGFRDHPAALHFDHLPGSEKLSAIATMARYSWGRVLEEIAKCEVVCANCHAIRTVNRRIANTKAALSAN